MNLRKRLQYPNVMMRVGLVLMILASVAKYFLHPTAHFGEGWADGTIGLLYGLCIGCLLLSIRLRGRRCSSDAA